MLELKQGLFVESTELLRETIFEQAVILIAEYNEKGALGFTINKSFGRTLNELEEFKHSIAFPIYTGGPVDQEHLYFVHQRPDVIKEGVSISNGIYLGGNFQQAVEAINNRIITTIDLKIFIGYCGWDTGELEAEIEEGSWTVEEGMKEKVFMNW
ncbi:MAG: YqgE/AlgH family protein [Chitinophagaceae bacterium]|nr:YqgE/AlgH family protein [Chitinophagaceae bacterium]